LPSQLLLTRLNCRGKYTNIDQDPSTGDASPMGREVAGRQPRGGAPWGRQHGPQPVVLRATRSPAEPGKPAAFSTDPPEEEGDGRCAPAAAVRGALGQAARPAAGAPVSEPVHGRRAAAEPVKTAAFSTDPREEKTRCRRAAHHPLGMHRASGRLQQLSTAPLAIARVRSVHGLVYRLSSGRANHRSVLSRKRL
jgi:hypothetical protein